MESPRWCAENRHSLYNLFIFFYDSSHLRLGFLKPTPTCVRFFGGNRWWRGIHYGTVCPFHRRLYNHNCNLVLVLFLWISKISANSRIRLWTHFYQRLGMCVHLMRTDSPNVLVLIRWPVVFLQSSWNEMYIHSIAIWVASGAGSGFGTVRVIFWWE